MLPFPTIGGKAYIISKNLPFDKVHDLIHILRTCSASDPEFGGLKEDCILLNPVYIETRYPAHWPTNYTKEMAEQCHVAAANIFRVVHDRLPS
jgi:HEPN domain-containing protein